MGSVISKPSDNSTRLSAMRKIKPHLIRSELIVARKHRTLEHAKQVKEIEKHNQEEIKKIADQVGDNKNKNDKTDKKDNKDGGKVVKVSKSDEQKGSGEKGGATDADTDLYGGGTTLIESSHSHPN
jgi:hypothetical protein